MRDTVSNYGGWNESRMRTSTMSTMKSYLPDDWEAIIKPVNKLASAGRKNSAIITSSDNCFLLSEIEIFGSTPYSVSGEGSQYAYYKAGNTKVKKVNGSANDWWELSPVGGSTENFCYVAKGGTASNGRAPLDFYVSFGFCV